MIRQPAPARMMAPWWSHLNNAKADGRLWVREVRKDVVPYVAELKRDATYRGAVVDMLDTLHVTTKARTELTALLEANPLVFKQTASVLDGPTYVAQGDARPIDDAAPRGNRVTLQVMFNEGTAVPVTNAWYDRQTLFVQVYGEATMHTRIATRPQDLSVDVPAAPNFRTFHLKVVDENGRLLKRGADFSGAPRP